jgi:hypothetical protein
MPDSPRLPKRDLPDGQLSFMDLLDRREALGRRLTAMTGEELNSLYLLVKSGEVADYKLEELEIEAWSRFRALFDEVIQPGLADFAARLPSRRVLARAGALKQSRSGNADMSAFSFEKLMEGQKIPINLLFDQADGADAGPGKIGLMGEQSKKIETSDNNVELSLLFSNNWFSGSMYGGLESALMKVFSSGDFSVLREYYSYILRIRMQDLGPRVQAIQSAVGDGVRGQQ